MSILSKPKQMKEKDSKDKWKVDPSSVLLYGKEEKQTGHVDISGLSQGWSSGSEKKLYRWLVLMKDKHGKQHGV